MEDFLKDAFYEETDEMFQLMEDCLLDIDNKGVTKDKIDNLFRYMHTIKGSSAAMDIHDMAKLTHYLEDILEKIRAGKMELTKRMVNQMLLGLDELKLRVSKHKRNEPYEIDIKQFILLFDNHITDFNDKGYTLNECVASGESIDKDMHRNLGLEERLYKITFNLHSEAKLIGARLFIIIDRLEKAGQVCETNWDNRDIDNIENQEFGIIIISELTKQETEDLILAIPDVERVKVSDVDQDALDVAQDLGDRLQKQDPEEIQSVIRVNIDKLDKLLRIVEELSVDKERLKQLMKRVEQKHSKDSDVKELSHLVNQIDFIGKEMQESVMSTRMHTLDSVFRRFPRTVRDLSIKQGKEIELKIQGESTELDRSIIEKIIDPLTHIIRNSIDHGIERPEERIKQGKEAKGTIKIVAGQEEGHIYIRVEDDGRGINLEELKTDAVRKGLMSRIEVDNLTEKELLEIIFMPGFSTAQEVTDISGRGVGMNVVKENIEKINGVIDIDNHEGRGLAFTFKLPLTLAIIQSLLIKAHKYRFALPLLSVIEIIRIKEEDYHKKIKFMNGNEILNWRGEILPIIRGADLFGDENRDKDKFFIGIVTGFSTSKIILGVEEIIGQQQVVIKSLDKFTGKYNVLGELKGIFGTAILGDGDFAYMLDAQALVKGTIKR